MRRALLDAFSDPPRTGGILSRHVVDITAWTQTQSGPRRLVVSLIFTETHHYSSLHLSSSTLLLLFILLPLLSIPLF